MTSRTVSRPAEERAVAGLLDAVAERPMALVVEGEPGIGKTTLWLAAVEQARERGFHVLSARPAAAESRLAYASLADLLAGVDATVRAALPGPQLLAVDRVLLRADATGLPTDQRAIGAALLSVVAKLADGAPVLVAIDDVQWLDQSSAHAIEFATRRFTSRMGLLACVRTGPEHAGASAWPQLPSPEAVDRISMRPLSLGALHAVVTARLGRALSRPVMVRIRELSRGNPFFALELARRMQADPGLTMPLPGTLTDLVAARIDGIDQDVGEALLAAASVAEPTVELVARATNTGTSTAVGLLENAERNGIIGLDGHRIRFAHPLLAAGVYGDAAPWRRRAMHRRLAELVDQPELRARHLALASVHGGRRTLESLDEAAAIARGRGAPAAAAELLDLAVGLGGATPERRIQLALHHFDAGETERARRVIEQTIDDLPPGAVRARATSVLAVVRLHDDSFDEAAGLLESALREVGDDLRLRVEILIRLAYAVVNTGRPAESVDRAEDGVRAAEDLNEPHLLGQALGLRVTLRFLNGDGFDSHGMELAIGLQDRRAATPVAFRPDVQRSLLLAWTGDLDEAHRGMLDIRRLCLEHGEESALIFIDFHSVLIENWRGDVVGAELVAEDAMERAILLGGDVPHAVALTLRGWLAAHLGRCDQAREDAREALTIYRRCGWHTLAVWPIVTLGFLEVSTGRYDAAMEALEPLLAVVRERPHATEIVAAAFLPDAVEALIHLGRLDEADELTAILEHNGRRLDRAWATATGGRCRAMLLAAGGDIDAAADSARSAMAEHERLPMPFERARTQLLCGQLQRRGRHRQAAAETLAEAVRMFDDLGATLWAARARGELSRVDVHPGGGLTLTAAERRVAELAATGMTNREVAAALFISPKTVEANIARAYRKLNIRSRAELGHHMAHRETPDSRQRRFP
ncbi:AAA family ATPase [Pseudonocardia spinosispora]|uniref:AAA family ATPase n=1 Tax=Pseudonocardia spinosispora TaxID=103441 RepID=UPI00048AD822|nr:LuxR family transcriptional regulator [Pseudonocardia spinosispora]